MRDYFTIQAVRMKWPPSAFLSFMETETETENTINLYYNAGLLPINNRSPKPLRNALYEIAKYFRREFQYDFVQYYPDDTDNYRAMIFWIDNPNYSLNSALVYGAVCFRWRHSNQRKSGSQGWGLQWIWLHPYFRNQKHLTRVWPLLKRFAPGFEVEGPLSSAMAHFLDKHEAKQSSP